MAIGCDCCWLLVFFLSIATFVTVIVPMLTRDVSGIVEDYTMSGKPTIASVAARNGITNVSALYRLQPTMTPFCPVGTMNGRGGQCYSTKCPSNYAYDANRSTCSRKSIEVKITNPDNVTKKCPIGSSRIGDVCYGACPIGYTHDNTSNNPTPPRLCIPKIAVDRPETIEATVVASGQCGPQYELKTETGLCTLLSSKKA